MLHLRLSPLHEGGSLDANPFGSPLWLRIICCLSLVVPVLMIYFYRQKIRTTSKSNPLWVTPPDIVFRIWIIIDLLIDAAAVYALINDAWKPAPWLLFLAGNVFNLLWALAFIQGSGPMFALALVFNVLINASNEAIYILTGTGDIT